MAHVLQTRARMDRDESSRRIEAPFLDATGAPEGLPDVPIGIAGREERERDAAWRRGEDRASEGGRQAREPYRGNARESVANRAFAALAENVRDFAIFLMNPSGIITFWGESAHRIKGWTKGQAEGAHLRLLYPGGGSEDGTAEAHLETAARTGEYIGEGQRVRRDGSTFWAGISLTALHDTAGELIGFAKVARDLTGRRAADAALRASRNDAEEARRRAEEASRTKSVFLATMSHEIRTPVNAVMGYVDLLELQLAGPLTEKQQAYLGRIRASNMHLLGIIDEILDFSRLDAGRVAIDRRAGRLDIPIRAALQMVEMQAQEKGVAISDSARAAVEDVGYWGDEDRVRQILVVLLSNAVKFTPSGGRITVTTGAAETCPSDVQLRGPGPWVYVRVGDTGPGIPPERVAAIFEPFEQGDMSLTRRHGGTGLGLTIARRLAQLMDGDLTVRSDPGVGSSFFLWLGGAAEEIVGSPRSRSEHMDPPGPRLLDDVRDAVMLELERIVYTFVARLRSDPVTPSARSISEAELEDHLATFLADLADTFRAIDLAAGADSEALRDGTAIQRTLAERHGQQRRRLGWSETEIGREFQILREEVAAAIQRRIPPGRPEGLLEEVLQGIHSSITAAEQISLVTYRESAQ
jgi:PAS domain S-box-containing protein